MSKTPDPFSAPLNLSRHGRILLAVSLALVWILARQHIAQMDDRFFRLSLPGIKGLVFYTIGDYSGAAKAYRAHLEEEFQAGSSTGHTGWDALLRGEFGPARHFSQQMLEKDPEDLYALLTLGELALMENAQTHALELFGRVLKKEPDQFDALLLSAIAFARSGDQGQAMHSLNLALRTNRIERRITTFLMALQETGDLAQRPKGERPLCLLAQYYRYLRIFDDSNSEPAISYAEKAIVAGDRPADAYVTIGIMHQKQNRPEDALAAFLNAIEADPKQAEAYRWAAMVYLERGGDLLNEYRMRKGAYEAAPDDPFYAIWHLEFLYGKMGDFRQALEISLAALDRWPENVGLLRQAGNIYQWLGEHEHSIAYHRKLLAIEPRNVEVHNAIGFSLYELGTPEDAIAEYKETLAIDPHEVAAHKSLARIYHQENRNKEAIAEYETVQQLRSLSIDERASLCSLYHFELQFMRAAECFKTVIALDPNNKAAANLLPYTLKSLQQKASR